VSARPWYRRFGSDFIAGTLGLTLEEKGAYSLILDLIYDHGGPIADDPRYIAGVCGCSVRKWTTIRTALIHAGKIVLGEGTISNSRAEFELETDAKTARKLAENGAKGGNKRAENQAGRNENNNLDEAGLKHRAPVQNPEPEKKKEGATHPSKRARKTHLTSLPDDWQPDEADFDYGAGIGLTRRQIADRAEDMRLWARSKGERKADWRATFRGFLRRTAKPSSTGPPRRGQQSKPTWKDIFDGADNPKAETSNEQRYDLDLTAEVVTRGNA